MRNPTTVRVGLAKFVLIATCACFIFVPVMAEAGGYYRSGHGYGHKSYYKHGYHGKHGHYRPGNRKHYGYRRHHDDDIEVGEILAGVFLGGLALYALTQPYNDGSAYRVSRRVTSRPASYYDCRPTTGEAYRGGRVLIYEGVLCRSDSGPGWYLQPGSRRFLGYAN
jgi:hypothetical protein